MGQIAPLFPVTAHQTTRTVPIALLVATTCFALLSRWTANIALLTATTISFVPCYAALAWFFFKREMPPHCAWLLPFGPLLCIGIITTAYYESNRLLFWVGLLSLGLSVTSALKAIYSHTKWRHPSGSATERESPWYLKGRIPITLIFITIVGELIELYDSQPHNLFHNSAVHLANGMSMFRLLSYTGIIEPKYQLAMIASGTLMVIVFFRRLKIPDWICWSLLLIITRNGRLWFISAEYEKLLTREDAAWHRCTELMYGIELGFLFSIAYILIHLPISLYLEKPQADKCI